MVFLWWLTAFLIHLSPTSTMKLEAAHLTFRATVERREPGWLLGMQTSAQLLQLLFPSLQLLVLVNALLKMG